MSEEVKEQVKYDWKELRIAEYAQLENEINIETHELVTDPEMSRLIKERTMLDAEIEEVGAIYDKNIKAAQEQQAGIKLELTENWDIPEKTFECTAGVATLRTTKSLHIRSKEKLVAFLELNKKLTEFIKSFEITKLRKIKDAGMLEDEIATWDEKKNVAIKLAEADQ